MKKYEALFENGSVCLYKNGEKWFSMPAAVQVNGVVYAPELKAAEDALLFASDEAELSFKLLDDSIEVDFSLLAKEDMPIYDVICFKNECGGMDIGHFDRAFCPQPRINADFNMSYYKALPDCSLTGYFSPSILNFTVGNAQGLVSFGLLDLPDSSQYLMKENFSILVEACGGNKVIKKGERYVMPKLLITFPDDDWQGISIFRQKLIDYNRYTPSRKQFSEIPEWWKNPIVCIYGDEIAELGLIDVDMNGPMINADWVRGLVDKAEKEWGIKHMNIVLDAFWQIQFALDPKVDKPRFGNMRDFNDEMHARGHHVIAWITPMFDSIANGFETRSQKLGVLSNRALAPLGVEGNYSIDLTHDNAPQYYKEVAQVLFGTGEGEYNFDGVKMDYMALQRDPAIHGPYAHPEKGLGIKELKLFYEMFYDAAKTAKADAIVDCSATDPRFEHLIDFNRMHDTHCGNVEKEMRAKISALACPDMLIDSDGALMYSAWARHHYICAAVYSIPANYYTIRYEDYRFPEEKALGTLLQMTKYRPDGMPQMESFGNWKLVDKKGQVNALSQNGQTVVYYPWEGSKKGYIFTWLNESMVLPLNGRGLANFDPPVKGVQVDRVRDQAILRLKPGILYTFEDGVDNEQLQDIFKNHAEEQKAIVDYANGNKKDR